jgi:hypothetical protein
MTHRYGRDGRDSKKFEDKCLLFDLEFLKSISNKSFTDDYTSHLKEFVLSINDNTYTGSIE